jgi:hypothetical protein
LLLIGDHLRFLFPVQLFQLLVSSMSHLSRFAVCVTTILCAGVLLTCLLVFPRMYVEINQLHAQVINSVHEFKVSFGVWNRNFLCFWVNTDAAWSELMDIQSHLKPPLALTSEPPLLDSIFRPKRANGKLPEYCNCNLPTNCAPGLPGPRGLPGLDGGKHE